MTLAKQVALSISVCQIVTSAHFCCPLCFSLCTYVQLYCSCKIKCTNIFEVPEMPKRAVPEKKVPIAVPKKTGAPLAKGTCHHDYHKEGFGFFFK